MSAQPPVVAPRVDYSYEYGEMEKHIKEWGSLKNPEVMEKYHKEILDGMKKLKIGLGLLSPEGKEDSFLHIKEGAKLVKEGVLGIKEVAQKAGIISPPSDDEPISSTEGEDFMHKKTDKNN